MKGYKSIIGGLMILLFAGGIARADDRKEIEALYDRLRQAIATNHPEATLAMETPDFTAKTATGQTLTGKQLVAQMKQEAAGSKLRKMEIKLDTLKVQGKNATAITTFSFTSDMEEKGKRHVMAGVGKVRNTLVKTPQGWKFKTMEEEAARMTLDGRPFDPSKMGGSPPKR